MKPIYSKYIEVEVYCEYCKGFIKITKWKVKPGITKITHGICYSCKRVLNRINSTEEKGLPPRDI